MVALCNVTAADEVRILYSVPKIKIKECPYSVMVARLQAKSVS